MAIRKVLVDIDVMAPLHPALSQALDLARRADADVVLVDVVADVPARARTIVSADREQALIQERTRRLEGLAEKQRAKGARITTKVLRGAPTVALVREVIAGRHDILVRYHGRDLQAAKRFGVVDMQLLRKCPCPVWLVGVGERGRPRRIVAAVHPDSEHEMEHKLNLQILRTAAEFARLEKAKLTVLSAWAPFGISLVDDLMRPGEVREFSRTAKAAAETAIAELLRAAGDLGVRHDVQLVQGEASAAIPKFCKAHDTDLVVMGTVARGGLVGMVMGNTAERVLSRIRCSVLALKPEGFVSPIRA